VISQHRFDAASQAVHDAVRHGRFGRLTSGVASIPWWRDQDYYDSGEWRGTLALDGGGAIMNQGVHTVDLLIWMLGEPREVFAWTGCLAHQDVEVEDTAVATPFYVAPEQMMKDRAEYARKGIARGRALHEADQAQIDGSLVDA
jgi:UDP-N-acetyl-2-amino-2-deoxyglucuronate dehydrogenase